MIRDIKRAFLLGVFWGVVLTLLLWLILAFSEDDKISYNPKTELGVQT